LLDGLVLGAAGAAGAEDFLDSVSCFLGSIPAADGGCDKFFEQSDLTTRTMARTSSMGTKYMGELGAVPEQAVMPTTTDPW
jgi:hypothetical protein